MILYPNCEFCRTHTKTNQNRIAERDTKHAQIDNNQWVQIDNNQWVQIDDNQWVQIDDNQWVQIDN